MQPLQNIVSFDPNDHFQQVALGMAGRSFLASICGYAGTFFFTTHSPMIAAAYLGTVTLVNQIAYYALEKLKEYTSNPTTKHLLFVVQLLQFPFAFYFLLPGISLSGALKLEILAATAYFVAIPAFFHLGRISWNDPTTSNIAYAVGVMLPLASGLRSYAKQFN